MTTPGSALAADDLFLRLQAALAGEYSIERELGRGGMGVVYLAREVRLAREVAIKVLPPALAVSAAMRDQFVREAQTAARLSHPNIVPIYRVGEADDLVYFVMAYVAGETLAERIRQRGPLPPHHAARVLREVAWALTYAHADGIVHRDVKADNILLERSTGRALVMDFGIAATTAVASREIVGTPHYLSPEQIGGEPADARSDLYSLGVVGYLALSGRFPFDGTTADAIIARHLRDRHAPLATAAPTVPAKLAAVVERCLAKRPELRFESAAAFAEAVDGAIEPPREIPPAIRVWLMNGQRGHNARLVLSTYLMFVGGSGVGLAASSVLIGVTFGLLSAAFIGLGPTIFRTGRVLDAGYGIDDLRAGLREYWTRRREEIAYEWGYTAGTSAHTLMIVGAVSTAVLVAAMRFVAVPHPPPPVVLLTAVSAITAAGSFVLGIARFARQRSAARLGSTQMKFWNSNWGERLVWLASIGRKKVAPAQSMSQLTEVALGRATEVLFAALPREHQKQLKALPGLVRRLEADATRLREDVEKLEASVAALDQDSATLADSPREADLRMQRDQLRADLRATRARSGERLAATVAALENIRLDLLRLQLGQGRIESVTATLGIARQVLADLDHVVEANREVDALLQLPLDRRAGELTPT
jgi:predicted Ser/Thr protein kinase